MPTQIRSLYPGAVVELEFVGNRDPFELAVFLEHRGKGDDQVAVFRQSENVGRTPAGQLADPLGFEWEAYRFQGRWAYGTSANPLRLNRIVIPGIEPVTSEFQLTRIQN